jgi:hypothetical protein
MNTKTLLKISTLLLALCFMVAVGAASINSHQVGPLSATAMQGLVGANQMACAGTFIGLGFGLLVGGVAVALTGGAAAPFLVLAGAYAPVGAIFCS